jgi:hypothetical protein
MAKKKTHAFVNHLDDDMAQSLELYKPDMPPNPPLILHLRTRLCTTLNLEAPRPYPIINRGGRG